MRPAVEPGLRIDNRSQHDEERVRLAGALGTQPFQLIDPLDGERSDQGVPVGEVAVQRRLADACAARDLVHRDVA